MLELRERFGRPDAVDELEKELKQCVEMHWR
jgi:hypothetical protein